MRVDVLDIVNTMHAAPKPRFDGDECHIKLVGRDETVTLKADTSHLRGDGEPELRWTVDLYV